MATLFEQALNYAAGSAVGVVLVTNQRGGVVSYATGSLYVRDVPAYPPSGVFIPGGRQLVTVPHAPLRYLFSDRKVDVAGLSNPFSIADSDSLGLRLGTGLDGRTYAAVTLLNWGDDAYTVPLTESGGVLVGVGSSVGYAVSEALYAISFLDVDVEN